MSDRILLDYNHMLAPHLGGRGITPEQLAGALPLVERARHEVEERRAAGELGFFALPDAHAVIEDLLRFAAGRAPAFDTVIVLGIGGSALGAATLQQALLRPHWNELDRSARDGHPRLFILDNIDPTTIAPLLERLEPERTLVNVVSKSGATAETMAQYLIIREWLDRALGAGPARDHLVFTTDPQGGVLREIAEHEGVTAFPIPGNVGGRFSVLSAVGLLPAALMGIDIRALLAGAHAMDERCRSAELRENPAALYALLQYLADTGRRAPIQVMMAYSDRLFPAADWFRQLWGESLGKRFGRDGQERFTGPTPVKALGATDQHSQIQLYMEGPFDKTITFLTVRDASLDLAIPERYPDLAALRYLGGHTLGELLRAEQKATAHALAAEGRMNMTIELPALTPHVLGQLFMMLQIATVYAGAFYGIDPLDQPGVELGKRLTYALMGRDGYQAPPLPEPDPRFLCR